MKHTLRRGIVATAVVALGAGLLGAAPAAQAAPNSYAYSAARWLDDQLTDGVVHNEQYDFDDLGLTIDVFLALHDLDTRAATQQRIVEALASKVDEYTTGGSFAPDDRYAGATGKLASAVQEAGQDATSFGGVNLVQRAEERVVTEGTSAGRASDLSEYGDYSNTIGQAWVVRALSTASSSRAASTVEYLLKQQCANGGFRVSMADEQCGTPGAEQGPTVDATAFALQALGVAREHGISGLDDDVAEATDWLLRTQAADGSFSDGGTANTNSTGLAAATLRAVGQVGRAGAAASWIVSKQVTDAKAEDTALGNEIGAIAYDDAALQTGLEKGIPVEARDQWIRATAQAAVGVDAQLPPATFAVTAPTGYVAGGSTVAVRATGLAAGEKARVVLAGGGAVSVFANADGLATASVKAPARTGTVRATVTGSRSNRVGSTSVRVLAASARFPASVGATSVKVNGKVRVNARGLAAGEPVRIYYRSRYVATGTASSTGRFTTVIGVGPATGRKTVFVRGLTDTRQGTATLTVGR